MDVALEAARAAGDIIRDRFNSEHEVHFKGRSDIVTDVDLAAEKMILELLTKEFPEFSVLSEESRPIESDSPYKWIVDPLDGTRNYAHGIPHFCTIIALAKDNHIVAGLDLCCVDNGSNPCGYTAPYVTNLVERCVFANFGHCNFRQNRKIRES